MSYAKHFFRNSFLLSFASIIIQIMAMLMQVWMVRRIGPAGVGLFGLMESAYAPAAALALAGIRLSTTRLVLEHGGGVMRLCLRYSLLSGLLAGTLLFLAAPMAARQWVGVPVLSCGIRLLSLGLPLTALSACFSGFFAAKRLGGRMALSQLLEFAVHFLLMSSVLLLAVPETPAAACLLLAVCDLLADCLSFLFHLFFYRSVLERIAAPVRHQLPQLLKIAIPDAVGSWIRSGLVSARQLLVPKGLQRCGATAQSALHAFGLLHGMVFPLLGFPAMLLGTVSGLLIPEIADCCSRGQKRRLQSILQRAVHATLLLSFFVSALLLLYGRPVGQLLFRSAEGGRLLSLMAPLAPLLYLGTVTDCILKGLGLQAGILRINLVNALVSLLLTRLWVPRNGIPGYLASIYLSEALDLLLSLRLLFQKTELPLSFYRSVFAPILSTGCALLLPLLFFDRPAVVSAVLSPILYCLFLRLLGSISPEELRWLRTVFFQHN